MTRYSFIKIACFLCLLSLFAAPAISADTNVKYGIGTWVEKGHGNHRALVHVSQKVDAVLAHIEWRRRDKDPQKKDILVFDSTTGQQITNRKVANITRESGDIVFQPVTAPGNYEIYYLPYNPGTGNFDDAGTYFPPTDTADKAWLSSNGLNTSKLPGTLPKADLIEIQARNEFNRFDPMEVIATDKETKALLAKYSTRPYILFPEDRLHPIKMPDNLPLRWIKNGPSDKLSGEAQPGEYYPYQIGVFASKKAVKNVSVTFTALKTANGKIIPTSSMTCFNLGGTDWLGRPMKKRFDVGAGLVRALWIGLQVPDNASGVYKGQVTVKPEGEKSCTVKVQLTVAGDKIVNSGDDDLWRLSRLRWLNSTAGLDEDVIPPYTPIQLKGNIASVIGRQIVFAPNGLPGSITSNGREILAKPIQMDIETTSGMVIWRTGKPARVLKLKPDVMERVSTLTSDGFGYSVRSKTESDGVIDFRVTLTAKSAQNIRDIGLRVPIRSDVAPYMMGMSKRGGYRPASWSWSWDKNRTDNMVWIGDVDAGVQIKLSHDQDIWSGDFKEVGLPRAWDNNGKGGCVIGEDDDTVMVRAFTGDRQMKKGESLQFRFRLMVTPFKPIDVRHWNWRYGSWAVGGNIIHVHHATDQNPYINYPFITADLMRDYVKVCKAGNAGVNVYYGVGNLSNHVAEMWPLRSLGNEVFSTGEGMIYWDNKAVMNKSGGGYPWLMEHLVAGYVPAWRQPLPDGETDAAVFMQGLSRWHNYYVEGMRYYMNYTGVSGLYLDGIGYDREIMRRIAKVMYRVNPNSRLNYHGGNNYDWLDSRISTMNQTMEHLPYLSNLWFGEFFDYGRDPDYWLIEMSGLPFGITNEMLNYVDGGNQWRGMVYGMTGRMNASVSAMWKFWDEFGIQDANWLGYWNKKCPVKTDTKDIMATAYVKKDKTLISIGSWLKTDAKIKLTIDWKAIGIDPTKARLVAPAIENFQEATTFAPTDEIPVTASKGWLFIVSE